MRLRLQASPQATFSILPDSYATEALVRIGCDAPLGEQGVQTIHVVHPQPTHMSRLVGVVEDHFLGLRIECVDEVPDPTDTERFIAAHLEKSPRSELVCRGESNGVALAPKFFLSCSGMA
ncbi:MULTISPECIES: hypothetical protein [unclassified Streptomyces]|uniref:hypothetical protein n=1 Tax=unclassified Streptomyces TaxID=2593676 RepID=UPI002E2FB8EF|nr:MULTISPECIES: hypothetical protein [unclassified Streptomyces]WUC63610.1 hypothetical protein OG861_04885 [Streptomyces sp. NBC_00539]